MADYSDLLELWFGRHGLDREVIEEKSPLWWKKSDDTDNEIREKYSGLLSQALQGALDHWLDRPEGCLALIILLDQFSRNIYRHTARSFSQDETALQLAARGVDSGMDKKLRLIERVFFYMPFEHAESVRMQEKSLSLFNQLVEEAPGRDKEKFNDYLGFAVKHADIIKRFHRFPHRNQRLGRESTEEEIEFLKQPGSSF